MKSEDSTTRHREPAIGVAHVVMETDCMKETAAFMRKIGMIPVWDGDEVSVYEMRGGTHLLLFARETVTAGDAAFDLMVHDLHATRERFAGMGISCSEIEAIPKIDHEVFRIREPAGHQITIYSDHTSCKR